MHQWVSDYTHGTWFTPTRRKDVRSDCVCVRRRFCLRLHWGCVFFPASLSAASVCPSEPSSVRIPPPWSHDPVSLHSFKKKKKEEDIIAGTWRLPAMPYTPIAVYSDDSDWTFKHRVHICTGKTNTSVPLQLYPSKLLSRYLCGEASHTHTAVNVGGVFFFPVLSFLMCFWEPTVTVQ